MARNKSFAPEIAVKEADTPSILELERSVEDGSHSPDEGREAAITPCSAYSNVFQGPPIHGLISASTSLRNMEIDKVTRSGMVESDGVTFTIDDTITQSLSSPTIQAIRPNTHKLLILILDRFSHQIPAKTNNLDIIDKGRFVRITLDEYMEACGLRDRKWARSQLNKSALELYSISMEWDEDEWEKPEGKRRAVKNTFHHRMRITAHTASPNEGNPVKGGALKIWLDFDLAKYLAKTYVMPYHRGLYKLNTNDYPHSIQLCWKLLFLHNMNRNKPKRRNTTTVKTLLSAAKDIPTYESLIEKGRIYERIIRPFDRNLAALVDVGVLSCYWYFDDHDNRIDGQRLGSLSYTEFSKLHIHYELLDYPDQS